MRKRQNSKRVELGVAETPLGKGLEVKPGVTLDAPANCLNRSLSGTLNTWRSDERIRSYPL